jgi:hypothetical protein
MSRDLVMRVGLDMPHLPAGHKVEPILRSALAEHAQKGLRPSSAPLPPHLARIWEPSQFGLDKVAYYHDAGEDDRRAMLALCARRVLEEAYFIEKSGLAYTGKMILLSETTEERMLYALFGADEASHLRAIGSWLPDAHPTRADDQFLSLLSELIESGQRDTLVFVIQVVLEGWGITHYGDIARACKSDGLRQTLLAIVKDEARHHGSGVQLWAARAVSPAVIEEVVEVLARFLGMVRVGPVGVLSVIERVADGLTRAQRLQVLRELGGEAHAATRLALLRRLMEKAGAAAIVEALESRGLFTPCAAEDVLGEEAA